MNHVTPEYEKEVRTLLRRLMAAERADARRIMADVEAELQQEEADRFKLPAPTAARVSVPWIDEIISRARRTAPGPELSDAAERTG